MNSSLFLLIIFLLVIFNFIFDKILDYLNLRSFSPKLPDYARPIYDEDQYYKARNYFLVNFRFSQIISSYTFLIMILVLSTGTLGKVDQLAGNISSNELFVPLIYFAILGVAGEILFLPFSLYRTFVIEERFGFNRTRPKTFVGDRIKGYLISGILGGGLLLLVVLIFQKTGAYFWLLVWGVITIFMILANMFYASLILPLFNKLRPMEAGPLREAIQDYCAKVDFKLEDLFVMDGSKRSTKANAFFSGLGKKKKIVLYDTLIEKQTTEEIVAVLAHEIGHFKKKHTREMLLLGIIQTGLMLFLFSFFAQSIELASALGASEPSFHIGLTGFGLLYSPVSIILGITINILSRKNEFEADRFAAETLNPDALISSLKKLYADSLSNPVPNPVYVFVHYSHPPLLERVKALKAKEM